MSEEACPHFALYVRDNGRETFSQVNACFGACVSKEARRQKVNIKGEFE